MGYDSRYGAAGLDYDQIPVEHQVEWENSAERHGAHFWFCDILEIDFFGVVTTLYESGELNESSDNFRTRGKSFSVIHGWLFHFASEFVETSVRMDSL